MYMVEIKDDKFESLHECMSKGVRYLSKAMECIGELKSSRDDEDDDYDDDYYEKRRRSRRESGRYGRY